MITATITITVTPLTDNEVWFANAAAWNNYWEDVAGTIEIDGAPTTLYAESAYDTGLEPVVFNYGGTDFVIVQQVQFDSLLLMVNTLNNNYKLFRNELKNAGFITNSQ